VVMNVTGFGRNGLSDWLVQRISAVILVVYFVVMMGFFVTATCGDTLTYERWVAFMGCALMRIFSFLALMSVIAHAWIGLWTVSTDYIKPANLRLAFQLVCFLVLFAYLSFGAQALWGI